MTIKSYQLQDLYTYVSITVVVQNYTGKYHELVAICITNHESVLLQVHGMSNNAGGNKHVIFFWYTMLALLSAFIFRRGERRACKYSVAWYYYPRSQCCPALPTDVHWDLGLPSCCHGREWTDWDRTKVSHLLHPVPTVHPIPLYHGTEWTDWGRTKVSHLLNPVILLVTLRSLSCMSILTDSGEQISCTLSLQVCCKCSYVLNKLNC